MTTPWSVKNELKGSVLLEVRVSNRRAGGHAGDPGQERAQDIGTTGGAVRRAVIDPEPRAVRSTARVLSWPGPPRAPRVSPARAARRPGRRSSGRRRAPVARRRRGYGPP